MARRIENEIVEYELGSHQSQSPVEVQSAPAEHHVDHQNKTSDLLALGKKHYRIFFIGLFISLILIGGITFINRSGGVKGVGQKNAVRRAVQRETSVRSAAWKVHRSFSHRRKPRSYFHKKRRPPLKNRVLRRYRPAPVSSSVPLPRRSRVPVSPRSAQASSSSSSSSAGDAEFGIE